MATTKINVTYYDSPNTGKTIEIIGIKSALIHASIGRCVITGLVCKPLSYWIEIQPICSFRIDRRIVHPYSADEKFLLEYIDWSRPVPSRKEYFSLSEIEQKEKFIALLTKVYTSYRAHFMKDIN